MMKIKNIGILAIATAVLSITFSACNKSPYSGYEQAENGVFYKFYEQNEDSTKAKEGDVVKLIMSYRTDTDSVLFDSKTMNRNGNVYVEFPLASPLFEGSFEDALSLMAVGDSASFLIPADSLFAKREGVPEQEMPEFIRKGSMLTFDVKLASLTLAEDFEKQRLQEQEEYHAMLESFKAKEPQLIANYLADNKISIKPSELGLYYIPKTKGRGSKPQKGDTVYVNYTGRFIDGRIFDTNVEAIGNINGQNSEGRSYEPIPFVLYEGGVIAGWHEGISQMSKGGKATLVIPSNLAYGERGAGGIIPPFTPLLFDVELVNIAIKK